MEHAGRLQASKKPARGRLEFVVEQKRHSANTTIYLKKARIKVTRNWFAVISFCESSSKNI